MRIGLIADTHIPEAGPELPAYVLDPLRDVDLILHAGDVFLPRVLDQLEAIAPVVCALGNHDPGLVGDARVRPVQRLELEGFRVALLHAFEPLELGIEELTRVLLDAEPADIVVSGDSHFERMVRLGDTLVVNPGSPTLPRNLSSRPGTLGFLTLHRGAPPEVELRDLSGGANDHLMQHRPRFH